MILCNFAVFSLLTFLICLHCTVVLVALFFLFLVYYCYYELIKSVIPVALVNVFLLLLSNMRLCCAVMDGTEQLS